MAPFSPRNPRRLRRPRHLIPPLRISQILRWADDYRARAGRWPTMYSGRITGTDNTWLAVDHALRRGCRSLPGGTSLTRLLSAHRGHRNIRELPPLSVSQILAWAETHRKRNGCWPTINSGPIPSTRGETWNSVNSTLRAGSRGLTSKSSLTKLLLEHRGVRSKAYLPEVPITQILAWADNFRRRFDRWPKRNSGAIPDAPGETWHQVDAALYFGRRGLPGRSSLAQLLSEHRGVRNHLTLPRLTPRKILRWADEHRRRTGKWPVNDSGPVAAVPGQTWAAADMALREGLRGLPGGSSLAQLLAKERGVCNCSQRPRLTLRQILTWADAHHRRTGSWPNENSGRIDEALDETWGGVDMALRNGRRSLPGGSSLPRLLAKHRGVRNKGCLPRLTHKQIIAWANAERKRTGKWPTRGPIREAPGETWQGVAAVVRGGYRGLPGGESLSRLLNLGLGGRKKANY